MSGSTPSPALSAAAGRPPSRPRPRPPRARPRPPPGPPPATTAPWAPSGLTASAPSGTQVTLGWYDNSTNESGFKIDRYSDAGGWSQVATVGAGVTSYADSGLNPSASYAYRIRATNAAG